MAENKTSFLLSCDLIHTVKKMPKADAGELFVHILEYVNDLNPETSNMVVDLVFEPIKQRLKRDLIKYEGIKAKNKENVLKRWNKSNTTVYDRIPTDTKHTVNDNDNDSDNDNDIDKEKKIINNIEDRKLKFSSTLNPFLEKYGKDLLNDFYRYWTEPNKSKTKFRQETEKFWDLEKRLNTWAGREKNNFNGKIIPIGQPAKGKIEQGLETMDRVLKNMLKAE